MQIQNLTDNKNVRTIDQKGIFQVIEYDTDLSLNTPGAAMNAYFMKKQNINKRQIIAELNGGPGLVLSPGYMQWIAGDIKSKTNVKGLGDLFGKAIRGKVTGESAINPLYEGKGLVVTEPTYKHILLEDVSAHGGLIVSDGMFLACEDTLQMKAAAAKTLSGALLGGQGLFNLKLSGSGIVALESSIPASEIVKVTLTKGETLQIDGPYALMWDDELTMSVEKSGKSLLGSAVSGEGFVNVFRGEGSVWMSVTAGVAESRVHAG